MTSRSVWSAQGSFPISSGFRWSSRTRASLPAIFSTQDPTWQWGKESDLWYPHVYEFNSGPFPSPVQLISRAGGTMAPALGFRRPCCPPSSFYTLPNPSVVAEGFFDTTMVNGAPYPVVSVPPKRVRFRMLNGSQARFYHLNLYPEGSIAPRRGQGWHAWAGNVPGRHRGWLPAGGGDPQQHHPYPI